MTDHSVAFDMKGHEDSEGLRSLGLVAVAVEKIVIGSNWNTIIER